MLTPCAQVHEGSCAAPLASEVFESNNSPQVLVCAPVRLHCAAGMCRSGEQLELERFCLMFPIDS